LMKKYTIASMTGFASKTFVLTAPSGERSTVSMNLKSVNSRFFEALVKLPIALSHLETTLTKLFKEKLLRGNIYCTVYLSNPNVFEGKITLATTVVDGYVHSMREIQKTFNLSDEIKLDNILRLPNIFSKEEQQIDEQSLQQIMAAAHELVEGVMHERAIE